MSEFQKEVAKKLVIAALSAITVRVVNRSMDAVGFHASAAPKKGK